MDNAKPTDIIRVTLQVVVDDILDAPWDNQRSTIMPTSVPRIAQDKLRRDILDNKFDFHMLLSRIPKHSNNKKYTPTYMVEYRLVEKNGLCGDVWFVEIDLRYIRPRSSVDDAQLLADIFVQLSDGWGEGVSEMRFGECVCYDDGWVLDAPERDYNEEDGNYNVTGRFAFNLTAIGASIQ